MKFDLPTVAFATIVSLFFLTPAVRSSPLMLFAFVAVYYALVAYFFPKLAVSVLAGIAVAYGLKMILPPQYALDGFRDVDCAGITCPEGSFCQQNACIKRYVGGAVPDGNE
jgi:hypothetical protein